MDNVRVPDIKVKVSVEDQDICVIEFRQTHRAPAAWEITGAIYSADAREAVRSCFLACLAELNSGSWESYTFEAEGGNPQDDQPQLPWN